MVVLVRRKIRYIWSGVVLLFLGCFVWRNMAVLGGKIIHRWASALFWCFYVVFVVYT